MEGGKQQNFWPGFVDALSNVVLVMIFVVVVFVVTLFYYSQKLAAYKASKLLEQRERQEQVVPQAATLSEISTRNDDSNVDAARINIENQRQREEIAELKGQVAQLKMKLAHANTAVVGSLRSDEGAPADTIRVERADRPTVRESAPGIRLDSRMDALTLHFERDGVELTAEATKWLNSHIKRWTDRARAHQGKLVITGVVASASFTEDRRRAYYRTVAIRNYLIDLGVDPDRITSRVVPGKAGPESASIVIIQYVDGK